jgi:hypothetical protein
MSYFRVVISHIPGRYFRSEEDLRPRHSGFFHERPDGICARLFIAVGASRVHMSVASGKGVTSDLFAIGCRSTFTITMST